MIPVLAHNHKQKQAYTGKSPGYRRSRGRFCDRHSVFTAGTGVLGADFDDVLIACRDSFYDVPCHFANLNLVFTTGTMFFFLGNIENFPPHGNIFRYCITARMIATPGMLLNDNDGLFGLLMFLWKLIEEAFKLCLRGICIVCLFGFRAEHRFAQQRILSTEFSVIKKQGPHQRLKYFAVGRDVFFGLNSIDLHII